jgi:hypothetical protein
MDDIFRFRAVAHPFIRMAVQQPEVSLVNFRKSSLVALFEQHRQFVIGIFTKLAQWRLIAD